MQRIPRFLGSPFASALAGGLIVALFGWVAIAAGWIEGDDDPSASLAPVPLAQNVADGDDGSVEGLSVNEIYDKVAGGVVYIEAQTQPGPSPFNPFGPQGGGTATGSGFVIDDDGHVVTNDHVVDGASEVEVKLTEDGESYPAEVVGTDPSTDIAVLDVEAPADELNPVALGRSSEVEVGDPVVAIGNPFGLQRTATAGIVSAVQREIQAPNGFTIRNAIQTDAAINPGNSGGPLFDAAGRVIGVNSQIESRSGGNVGIGFAVPIDTAREVAEQLIDDGEVEHAYLGISGADLTPEIADLLNLDAERGALVQQVVPDSPADEAGIEAGDAEVTADGQPLTVGGDVIVAVDGEEVDGMDDVVAAVDEAQPGDEIELTILRDDEQRTVTVELGDRPASTSPGG
jgi:S1-C subfamily serine protease